MSREQDIEREIVEKGLMAPRVTPEDIDRAIVAEHYHIVPGTTVTICSLVLRNGWVVNGESACASHVNFDEELGRKIARENARQKIWPLEGYLLKELLHVGRESVA
ncbi:hypothetical protein JUN65_02005 [Gluconacetobacter azotocaptans]|uniref:Gp49 family protein n=1 Tax=Gluconacetobacter azotocaptans TaxID=142834 RepID=UPI00195BD24C|nr:Gp49 family protein [Gluconacetobacter azotocaptans]MBM9400367.1 hypothetical protein [Gluconacetobacter azotocaptans]